MKGILKKYILSSIIAPLSLFMISPLSSDSGKNIIIDNFDNYDNNLFKTWLLRTGSVAEAKKIYSIAAENNNKYLHAETRGDSIQIAKKIDWKINTRPFLAWKWRVTGIPAGANESAPGKNDSAAAVYAVFPRNNLPFVSWKYQPINVIKYVWSSTLPAGTIVKKQKEKIGATIYEGRFLVLRTGDGETGKWIAEKRNVLADHVKLFGKSPEYDPILIGILTDSNDTKSSAAADYDEIVIGDR